MLSFLFRTLAFITRGLGRDMAKLGEKLHQLEMAIGEFSLQQVYQFQTMSCIPPPPHLMKVKVRKGTNKERKSDMSNLKNKEGKQM